jgi:hypothetical protein
MANFRDNDDVPGKHLPNWQDWYKPIAASDAAPEYTADGLDAAWRAAVDSWWDGVAAITPPQARDLLKPAVDQAKAFVALANGVGRNAATETGDDVLWRQALQLWEQAAARMLTARSAVEPPPEDSDGALQAYKRALLEYADALRDVSNRALADVSDAWPTRQSSKQPPAGLRELFDLYVDLGEQRYYELVSSEDFAEIGGRLINSLVECVHQGQSFAGTSGVGEPVPAPAARSEGGETPDFPNLLADLGFELEQTMSELQAFGEKLDSGVATLRDLGTIHVGTSDKECCATASSPCIVTCPPASPPIGSPFSSCMPWPTAPT